MNPNMQNATVFLEKLFSKPLCDGLGKIEIRAFPKNSYPHSSFHESVTSALDDAVQLNDSNIDVYVGVNPRTGEGGKKENIHFLTAFHAEIDYGDIGHKKQPIYHDYEEAFTAIEQFDLKPTIMVHSGGGFHIYWVIRNPVPITENTIEELEAINKNLSLKLGGDTGTHDISRLLRIPDTNNFKQNDNPRPVELLECDGNLYDVKDFDQYRNRGEPCHKKKNSTKQTMQAKNETLSNNISIDNLPVPDRIKSLITDGYDGSCDSRSEADMAVITSLVNHGMEDSVIKQIFDKYAIGEKYRTHNDPDKYLTYNIEKAKSLSEENEHNPLFESGSLYEKTKGNGSEICLNIVRFQEYVSRKYICLYSIEENVLYIYNGRCYDYYNEDKINLLCQKELGKYRDRYTPEHPKKFIHYAKGDTQFKDIFSQDSKINYLTLQNGLFNVNEGKLIPHTPDIFTMNLLQYDYNPDEKCPRFMQFLEEIFYGDTEKIKFVQEAIGYAFHRAMPVASMFFFIGDGANGKTVLIDIITALFGEENTCNISLDLFSQEYYRLELFGKMINVSTETINKKIISTNRVKEVTSGDLVIARKPYGDPVKFRPFAKHYLAMNEFPELNDVSHGMLRRIYQIEFPRRFLENEADVDLTDKLKNELSGIFNWALEGYYRLRDNKFRFSKPSIMESQKRDFLYETNSVYKFVEHCLERTGDNDNRILLGSAYNSYIEFCQTSSITETEKKSTFKKMLLNLDFEVSSSTRDSNQICIFGVRLKK